MSASQPNGEPSERAFPLVALANLFTSCVALAVCVDGNRLLDKIGENLDRWPEMLAATAATGGVGMLLGAFIGIGQLARRRSILICGLAGTLAALATLAACVSPGPLAASIVAIFLPLVMVIALRVNSA